MIFPKDFPETLRSSILTSEVVGKRVKLKQRGPEFTGLCPFHNEKTSSFTVNDQKGFYHCFGCSAHGDIIGFVMNSEGMEFRDAVVKLADDFGIAIPKVKFDERGSDQFETQMQRDHLILEKATQFFEKNLHGSSASQARSYLSKRGLNTSSAKKFRLGFAPNSYEALTNFLTAENFSQAEISRTGIIGKNDRGKFYDKFRNRIIFPITNKKNHPVAFGGRVLGDEMPKYLNSAETAIFKKNQTLYNFAGARKAIFSKGYAVVVEGYMDVIALANAGIENVVAGLGTALGAEHIKELFHTTDKIIICLDGDAAGIRAAKRVTEIALPLISAKKSIFFAIIPGKMDPDDFVKNFGAKELEKLFNLSAPLSESLFEFALTELGIDRNKKISAENKAKLEANLNAKVEVIQDPASKKYFSLFVKDLLFSLGRGQKKLPLHFSKISASPVRNLSDDLCKNIIAYIIKFPELAQFRDDIFDISTLNLSSEKFTHLKELIVESEDHDLSDFAQEMKEIQNLVASLGDSDLELMPIKFRRLLLKDLLFQVEGQCVESLSKIDEAETHMTAITDQKIKETLDYKNSLQAMILAMDKELI